MSDNVRLWMGAFKSMSDTECGYGTFQEFKTVADFIAFLIMEIFHCSECTVTVHSHMVSGDLMNKQDGQR